MRIKRQYFVFLFLYFIITISCKIQNNQIKDFSISGDPVFSENDSFGYSKPGDKLFSRHEYYIVKWHIDNKEDLMKILDSFAKVKLNNGNKYFTNYSIYFYYESAKVNQSRIDSCEDRYRYKIFQENKHEDYIACYTFRDFTLSSVDWNSKY